MGLAVIPAAPADARRMEQRSDVANYLEARLAEASNAPEVAARLYAETLTNLPDNSLIAGKTYRQAIASGDFPTALRAVRAIGRNGMVDPEMPLLLFADAVAKGDRGEANRSLDQLKLLGNLAFMEPLLRSWVDSSIAPPGEADALGQFYARERDILQAMVARNEAAALQQLSTLDDDGQGRLSPLRILLARYLVERGKGDDARKLLEQPANSAEKTLLDGISAGRKVGERIDQRGAIGFLLARVGADVSAQNANFLGLVFAQCAKYLAPNNDYAVLTLARSYARNESDQLALAQFAAIPRISAYHRTALNSQVGIYSKSEKYADAIALLARDRADGGGVAEDFALLGQILQSSGDPAAAAEQFQTALALVKRDGDPRNEAAYWLLLGGAQEQAGQWPEALTALREADRLQPNSAVILNYLGYAQLERRENISDAVAAITRAHKLDPTSAAITDSLGWANFLIGNHGEAAQLLEAALQGQPDDPTINEHLGDTYWALGRLYEARYAWQAAVLFADDKNKARLEKKIDLGLTPELQSP
ncbi:MAG: tetratricopeptide repeat protein [Parasphingorhabdus sp.]|nr:tetratricopeptide repeat protein [Parasphingorhabdus sp.]